MVDGTKRERLALSLALGAFIALLLMAPTAGASIKDEFLLRFGSGFGSDPSAAGELSFVTATVVDPANGHIYAVGEGTNKRIASFTPWGDFVAAYGWDVAPGPVNEVQEARIRGSEGSFVLRFVAAETPELPFNASEQVVEEALEDLATIGGAGGEVTVTTRAGTSDATTPFVHVIAFEGTLAGTDVEELQAEAAEPLGVGGGAEARTRANGTAGGTGLEACTGESGCQAGTFGGGAGQFGNLYGATADETGIYVFDSQNLRIQKLTFDGRFLWTAGGDVN
jgi:hypothetical protein